MSGLREFRVRAVLEVGFVVEVDQDAHQPQDLALEAAERQAGRLMDALDEIFSVMGNTYGVHFIETRHDDLGS